MGSAIEGSGIDEAWVGTDLYAPVTTRQILEGKHMKRALDAHVITVQALSDLLLNEYDEHGLDDVRGLALTLGNACMEDDF